MLVCIAFDPDLTLRQIARQVGVTERATHHLVSELETQGVIERHKTGRRNHYSINRALPLPLRHPLEKDRTVGDQLTTLIGREQPERS